MPYQENCPEKDVKWVRPSSLTSSEAIIEPNPSKTGLLIQTRSQKYHKKVLKAKRKSQRKFDEDITEKVLRRDHKGQN